MAKSHSHISIIILYLFRCILGKNPCVLQNTKGYTTPHGDIIFQYGETLNINCNLHPNVLDEFGQNASSRLYFRRNNETVRSDLIEVLNFTSIKLRIPQHPKTERDNYSCIFRSWNDTDEVVCMNVVTVGVAPQNITDFSCISRNYEDVKCNWTPPQNFVKTDYSLSGYLKNGHPFHCPTPKKSCNGSICNFFIILEKPNYRQVHSPFYFQINMSNIFGSNETTYKFDHFKYVLPNAPENLTAIATSPHSLHLSWSIPSSMVGFLPGLHHRISYQCKYGNKEWQFGGLIKNRTKNKLEFELRGLKYAYAVYNIRVGMRSAKADEHNESMWSKNATISTRTKSKVPDCPPETNVGSFEVLKNGDVHVYWKKLKEEQKNGHNFSYYIEVANHHSVYPVELMNGYAKFQNLTASDVYIFNIWSVNERGRSIEKSVVAMYSNRVNEPINVIKLTNLLEYTLTWERPRDVEESGITSYTVFWCNYEQYKQCWDNLSWMMVSNNTVQYNQTTNKLYRFAVSANSHNISSGMTWALDCSIFGKTNNVSITQIGSDFIDLGFKLNCYDVMGTKNISYCQIKSSVQKNCKNITIEGNKELCRISKLKPNTTYKLEIAFINDQPDYSHTSEILVNTSEAAPTTPPLNVEVYNITDTTLSLKWQPPRDINGKLRYYVICYSRTCIKILPDQNGVTLRNLLSFTNYSIYVKACTVACSNFTKTITVMTNMSTPDTIIKQPSIISQNDTHRTISWEKPIHPRGEINYYEVRFKKTNKPDVIENVTSQTYIDKSCSSDEGMAVNVSVRAVNIINGNNKAGNWSRELQYTCNQKTPVVYYSLGAVLALFLSVGVTFIFKRIYIYCINIRDIEVILPEGLKPQEKTNFLVKEHGKYVGNIDISSRREQERLLEPFTTDTYLSNEPSGCNTLTTVPLELYHISFLNSKIKKEESVQNSQTCEDDSTITCPTVNKSHGFDKGSASSFAGTCPISEVNVINQTKTVLTYVPLPAISGVCLSNPTEKNSPYVLISNISAVDPNSVADTNLSYVPIFNISAAHSNKKGSPYVPVSDILRVNPNNHTEMDSLYVSGANPMKKTEIDSPYVPLSGIDSTIRMPYICNLLQPQSNLTLDDIKTPNHHVTHSNPELANKNPSYVVTGLIRNMSSSDLPESDIPKATNMEQKCSDIGTALEDIGFLKQRSSETNVPNIGYVPLGDGLSFKPISVITNGYVPHRQFEMKSIKED